MNQWMTGKAAAPGTEATRIGDKTSGVLKSEIWDAAVEAGDGNDVEDDGEADEIGEVDVSEVTKGDRARKRRKPETIRLVKLSAVTSSRTSTSSKADWLNLFAQLARFPHITFMLIWVWLGMVGSAIRCQKLTSAKSGGATSCLLKGIIWWDHEIPLNSLKALRS
ncbi:hypothetical protein F5887DRAFT_1160187 [Amanita rubescens]|nr:hypothetical protein F5887DRAFT_1160187 [Amanita rubescens]